MTALALVRDPRSALVGLVSLICLTRGIAYIQYQDLPYGLEIVARLVPIWVFALIWLAAAAAGIAVAIKRWMGSIVIAVQVGLFTLWGLGYSAAWVLAGFTGPSWIVASFYLTMAALVGVIGRLPPRRVI
jgi:hypothetical protein